MSFIYRILKKDPDSRDDIIIVTSGLGTVINIVVALAKVIIGILSSSIAIVSEGVNNGADALTSILTLLGNKLSKKHPDEKHPFGYGRIEYLTSLIISTLIIVTGVEMLSSSIRLVINPEEISISVLSLAIVAGTAVIKFFLGIYTIKMGKKAASGALTGVGLDCRNDSFASLITIISAVIFLTTGHSVDAFAGILISLLILKAGIELLRETIADLLGRPGEHELALELYKEIRSTPGILSAVDMMLHNYGPDAWTGSVNVEIDHNKSVGEIYQFLHELQLRIMHTHHVIMVFGVYAVDRDQAEIKKMREKIRSFLNEREHVKSFHALYLDEKTDTIYCDFIVDYKQSDWEGLKNEFLAFMGKHYPGKHVELTIETEFV